MSKQKKKAVDKVDVKNIKQNVESYNTETNTTNIIIIKDDKYITKHTTDEIIPMYSATKAIASLAIGFLLKDKLLKSVNTRLCDIFTDNKDLRHAPRSKITVSHILTHTSGLPGAHDWIRGGRDRFSKAADLCEYCLGRELSGKPGANYDYSNIGIQLIACIVTRLTGRQLNDYLLEKLFRPLGIRKYIWNARGGYTDAKGGLSMRVVDLYRIAQCIMNGGTYRGKRVISKEWIEAINKPLVKTGDDYAMQGLGWNINQFQPQYI